MIPTVLVTGFEPFGGESVNPSADVARALDGRVLAGGAARVVAEVLPCCFGQAHSALAQALKRHRPQLVLALGQAGGRSDFSIERVAINLDDARIADNAGHQPIDEPVVAGAPAAYFSTLPIKAIVAALRDAGLPASVSHSAGTFVCNHVFFALQHTVADQPDVRSGFMHLPLLPEQAARHPGQPSLPLQTLITGVAIALETGWRVRTDRRETAGTLA